MSNFSKYGSKQYNYFCSLVKLTIFSQLLTFLHTMSSGTGIRIKRDTCKIVSFLLVLRMQSDNDVQNVLLLFALVLYKCGVFWGAHTFTK